MTELFAAIVEMSLKAIPVICVLFCLRFLLKKVPKKYSYALWSVALFRLLCPVSVSSVFSLFNLRVDKVPSLSVPVQTAPTVSATPDQIPVDQINLPGEGLTVQQIVVEPPIAVKTVNWHLVLSVLWLVGVAAVLGYTLWRVVRLYRRTDGAVRLKDNVWECDGIPGPFVFGLFRPRILVPTWLGDGEREYVLAHERFHIRRFDPWAKAVCQLVLALHWFNPLVWLMLWAVDRDMEMSCDEGVLKGMDEDGRRDYSRTLLALGTGRREFGPVLAFGTPAVKRRILNVLQFRRATKITVVFAIVVLLVAGLTCCTDAKEEQNQSYAERLYNAQAEYVGDNSAVSYLTGVVLSETVYPYGDGKSGYPYRSIELDTAEEPYGLTIYLNANEVGLIEKLDAFRTAALMLALVDNLSWCKVDMPLSHGSVSMTVTVEQAGFWLGLDDLKAYSSDVESVEELLSKIAKMDSSFLSFEESSSAPEFTLVTSGTSVYSVPSKDGTLFTPFVRFYADGSYSLIYSSLSSVMHSGSYALKDDLIILKEDFSDATYMFRFAENNALEFVAEGSTPPEHFADDIRVVDGTRFYYDLVMSKYGSSAEIITAWDDFDDEEGYSQLYNTMVYLLFDEFHVGLQGDMLMINGVLPSHATVGEASDQIYRAGAIMLSVAENINIVGQQYVNGNRIASDVMTREGVEGDLGISNLLAYGKSPDALEELAVRIESYLANRQTPVAETVTTTYFRMVDPQLDETTIYTPDVGLVSDGSCFISCAVNDSLGYYTEDEFEICYYDTANGKNYFFRWIDEYSLELVEKSIHGNRSDKMEMSVTNDYRAAQPEVGTVFSKAVMYEGEWVFLKDIAAESDIYSDEHNTDFFRIAGYDAEYLEYSLLNGVYFVNPYFLSLWFNGRTVEGSVCWADESKTTIEVGFTLETIHGDGTVSGPNITYLVSLIDGTLVECRMEPDEFGGEIDLSEEDMISSALEMAEILKRAERYAALHDAL